MVPDISWWALDGNKHIFVPALLLVHRRTCLSSQYSPASKFTVIMLASLALFALIAMNTQGGLIFVTWRFRVIERHNSGCNED